MLRRMFSYLKTPTQKGLTQKGPSDCPVSQGTVPRKRTLPCLGGSQRGLPSLD